MIVYWKIEYDQLFTTQSLLLRGLKKKKLFENIVEKGNPGNQPLSQRTIFWITPNG